MGNSDVVTLQNILKFYMLIPWNSQTTCLRFKKNYATWNIDKECHCFISPGWWTYYTWNAPKNFRWL